MHIFKWEMRSHLKALIIWSLSIMILVFMWTSEFSAYYNNPEMNKLIDMIPDAMKKAFSMENANLTTTTGFLSFVAFYYYLLHSLYASLLGSSIIAKEERDKTAEYLMTMPVSREKIITSKLLASVASCIILVLVTVGSTIAAMFKYELDKEFYIYLCKLSLASLIVMLVFLGIGMILASAMRRYKSSGKISASIIMLMFFLSFIIPLSDKLDFLKYITPFKYFDPVKLLSKGSFDMKYVIISSVIFILSITASYLTYPRRDLRL